VMFAACGKNENKPLTDSHHACIIAHAIAPAEGVLGH